MINLLSSPWRRRSPHTVRSEEGCCRHAVEVRRGGLGRGYGIDEWWRELGQPWRARFGWARRWHARRFRPEEPGRRVRRGAWRAQRSERWPRRRRVREWRPRQPRTRQGLDAQRSRRGRTRERSIAWLSVGSHGRRGTVTFRGLPRPVGLERRARRRPPRRRIWGPESDRRQRQPRQPGNAGPVR